MVLQLNILKLTSPKDLIEIGLVVLEKNILRFHQWFFTISKLSPLRKRWALHLNYFKSPSPKDALCQVWLKLVKWFLGRRFSYIVNVFHYFVIISPWKRTGPFLNTLEFHSPKVARCRVWLKLAQWFLERRFLNFVNVFSLFRSFALHLNKVKSPSRKDA